MKTYVKALAIGLCAAALAGCGSTGSDQPAPAAPQASAEKVLRVGTDPTFPPFEYYQERSEGYTGFDVELIREVAAEAGYDGVEFVNANMTDLLSGLNAGLYDAVISSMSITDSRKEEAAFTNPYTTTEYVVLTRKGAGLTDRDSLRAMKISVRANSVSEQIARTLSDNVEPCTTVDNALLRMMSGASDAVITDRYVGLFYTANGYGDSMEISDMDISGDAELAIAVRRDDQELLRQLNEGLDSFQRSSRYTMLKKSYFGESY